MAHCQSNDVDMETTTEKRAALLKPFRGSKAFGRILDGISKKVTKEKILEAEEKWMSRSVISSENLAFVFLEAIKRRAIKSGIESQLAKMSPVSWILMHRLIPEKAHTLFFHPLPNKEIHLARLLERLFGHNRAWMTSIDFMLSQIKDQLILLDGQLTANQREALCRWGFYLCQRQPSEAILIKAKEILLLAVRRKCRPLDERQRIQYKAVINVFISLAVVWPSAFKRFIMEPGGDYERILQTIFCSIIYKWRHQTKIFCLLEEIGFLFPRDGEQQSEQMLLYMVTEQLREFENFKSMSYKMDGSYIQAPTKMNSCFQKLLLMAPYCDEGVFSMMVVPFVDQMTSYCDQKSSASGFKHLIPNILWLANVASMQPELLVGRSDEILASLRLMITDKNAKGKERQWLIRASMDLVNALVVMLLHVEEKKQEAEAFLQELKKKINKKTSSKNVKVELSKFINEK